MPDSTIQLYTKQYSDSLEMALQQRDSRFMDKFMQGSHRGESAAVLDRVDPVDTREVSGRFEPIGRVEHNYARRWIVPRSFDLPLYVDTFDDLKQTSNPQSTLVESSRAAFQRRHDDLCIDAFFGDARIGTQGTEVESWASFTGQVVGVTVGGNGANMGLNVEKLKAARKILKKNEVDFDQETVYIGYNAEADEDLLAEAQVVSLEYNERPILKDGKIVSFLGFTFVPTERLPVDGSGFRRLPVWTKSGMHFGRWGSPRVDISEDKTLKGYPWRVYSFETCNATRRDPKRVVEIKIAE
jgi:hypothetical protein